MQRPKFLHVFNFDILLKRSQLDSIFRIYFNVL